MALLDLLDKSPEQVKGKNIKQLIAFAGEGKLLDNSQCSMELRAFLARVASKDLIEFADQCLAESFPDSGLALQDVINEVGSRIGAEVTPGRYRGSTKEVGFDGLWKFPNGNAVIIEVKTTDTYRIDLNTVADYRRELIDANQTTEDKSSMLLIVGRQDTGDLEAQIRGSRYAWDIRIISVDALARLMSIKEEVDDPQIIQRIHSILIPREFTRLDEIADILFSAAEDLRQDAESTEVETENRGRKSKEPKFVPVAFHDACIDRIQGKLGLTLVKRSRSQYSTPDKTVLVNCAVSKEHSPDATPTYWFAFHPHQRQALEQSEDGYAAFGCGSSKQVLLFPKNEFISWLDTMRTTTRDDRYYWHVVIYKKGNEFTLHRSKGVPPVKVTKYLI